MNASASFLTQLSWSETLGAVIVLGGGLYLLFLAIDGLGLPEQQATAIIAGKEHYEAKQTYKTELIGGRTRVIPHMNPEKYLLKLTLGDQLTEGAVEKNLYEATQLNERVQVTYRQRRLTGNVEVTAIAREEKGE